MINIDGDGSFAMNSQELATCFTEGLPVKTVIINNSGHGMVRQWQRIIYKERYCAIDLPGIPDWVKLAEAYGCMGLRVTKPSEVVPALEKMISTPGPVVLDVCVDKDECVFPMVPAGGANTDMILAPPTREVRGAGRQVPDGVLASGRRTEHEKHTIAVLVENKFGVLSRVAGLFSARGYNIESLSVGETLDPSVSRMTLVVKGDAFVIEQVIKQLHKLIDVIKVTDLSEENHVEREMLLIKVNAEPAARAEILRIGDIFRAKVVDVTPSTYTLEVTGEESKIEAIIELLRPFGIQESCAPARWPSPAGPKTRLRRVEEKLGKPRDGRAAAAEDPKVVGFAD